MKKTLTYNWCTHHILYCTLIRGSRQNIEGLSTRKNTILHKNASNSICKEKSPLIKHNRIYRYRSMYTKVVFLLNLINTHCDNHKTFIYNTHFFIVNIKFITFQFIHSSSNSYCCTWYSTKYYKKTFGWYLHQLF